MKDVAVKLISELMKNSRKSDRELARAIGVSQPTVTRLRGKLEKEGIIKEYTMIPDFKRLGYQIMAVTFFGKQESRMKK
jgi:Lrp/AsnC family transcriptional regulator for asnA, asnC and gidA